MRGEISGAGRTGRVLSIAVVLLGALLVPGASATGLFKDQTISFTSVPPSRAVAGGSYQVSATSSSGLPVDISIGAPRAACSFAPPQKASWETNLEGTGTGETGQPAVERPSPQTVYFDAPGTCTIRALVAHRTEEYESAAAQPQSFAVARDPSEKVTFASRPPRKATVGGSYNPSVRSSAGLMVFFSSHTPTVCRLYEGFTASELLFLSPGRCTISVTDDRLSEAPEAQQSFPVSARSKKTPAKSAIPATVQATLLEEALRMAAREGDSHPYDIQAVLATYVRATHILSPGGSDSCQTTPACAKWPVYAVAMRGDFHYSGPAPAEAKIEESTVLAFTVPAKESPPVQMGTGFRLGDRYPNLQVLGVPARLEEHITGRHEKEAGTLVVHVYTVGGPAPPIGCYGTKCPNESTPIYVARLGLSRKIVHLTETKEHTVHVAPGEYEVALNETLLAHKQGKRVTVKAGRTVELTLTIDVP